MKMQHFLMLKVFSNFEWFKSNLENGTSSTKFVFSIFFLIIRPNIANDMALESLKKCKTFWYILFLQIHYGFTLILKMAKTYFRRNFYKLYRNGANNILLKSYKKF